MLFNNKTQETQELNNKNQLHTYIIMTDDHVIDAHWNDRNQKKKEKNIKKYAIQKKYNKKEGEKKKRAFR